MKKWLIPAAAASVLFASIACGQYKQAPANPAPAPAAQSTAPVLIPSIAPPPAPAAVDAQQPSDGARRMTRDEAVKLVAEGKAVWVDVRAKDQYDMEHIKGAINYPLGDLQTDLSKKVAAQKLPKHKFLITYCA